MNADKRSMKNKALYEKKLETMKARLGEEKIEEIRKISLGRETSQARSRKSVKTSVKQLRNLGVSHRKNYRILTVSRVMFSHNLRCSRLMLNGWNF